MNKTIFIIIKVFSYIIDYSVCVLLLLCFGRGSAFGYFSCLIVFFLYRYLTTAFMGCTVGMKLMGLRLQYYGLGSCLIREFARLGSGFYFIGYFYGIIDGEVRTLHDIVSGTVVNYKEVVNEKHKSNKIFYGAVIILTAFSAAKWSSSILLNDMGMFGLQKKYTSPSFYQSMSGDRLISLNQQQLYMNTLGRAYTALTEFHNKLYLTRISNKLKFTEVFVLMPHKGRLISRFAYRVPEGLQYISSGYYTDHRMLCGISPSGKLIVVNSSGKMIDWSFLKISRILTLTSGDINGDQRDEIVVCGVDGTLELFSLYKSKLVELHIGTPLKGISPAAIFISDKLTLIASGAKEDTKYTFDYKNGSLVLSSKNQITNHEISYAEETPFGLLTSNINRLNMTLGVGTLQRIDIYNDKNKLCYNLGARKGRLYNYKVRNVEGVYDVDGDGNDEIIIKSVPKGDIMGNHFQIEVYSFSKWGRTLNNILTIVDSKL